MTYIFKINLVRQKLVQTFCVMCHVAEDEINNIRIEHKIKGNFLKISSVKKTK